MTLVSITEGSRARLGHAEASQAVLPGLGLMEGSSEDMERRSPKGEGRGNFETALQS